MDVSTVRDRKVSLANVLSVDGAMKGVIVALLIVLVVQTWRILAVWLAAAAIIWLVTIPLVRRQ